MRIAREEIFGPVLCACRSRTRRGRSSRATTRRYGLAAGVWTRDLRKAHQAAAALQAGTVWVNCYNAFDNASPWGGYQAERLGPREGVVWP